MVITRSIFSRFFPLMLLCLFTACSMAYAQTLPWENENSVGSILLNQDGQSVLLEKVTVSKIEARNDPPYFVVQDGFKPDNRIVILSRPPSALTCGMTVDVSGTLVTLNTGERCLTDATTFGYFNKDGSLTGWSYGFMLCTGRQVLPISTDPIPPSDPSLTTDGRGIPGLVTSEPAEKPSAYGTVAALSTAPLLSTVEISCKPVRETGAGYIKVGDDNSDAAIKVYTNASVSPTDRIIKLTGTLHTEKGSHVIYADSGPEPYFDRQGYIGHVSAAGMGTVAYAATLSNPSESVSKTGGIHAMSASTPDTTNGNWVYLTGQLVTYVGGYWSYDASPAGWVNVYNIQGIDKTPGMRVWSPSLNSMSVGSIVDVFAKVDTKDGQRILGTWGGDTNATNATDLSDANHCLEPKVLFSTENTSNLLTVRPVGMTNKTLGGEALGENKSVDGGAGLYNIGSYVTVWGKVLEVGAFNFIPYMKIDDGSAVPSDGSIGQVQKGVIVFRCSSYDPFQPVVGDYVAVTGVSSIWKPSGSENKYRCIWTTDTVKDLLNEDTPIGVGATTNINGTISGTLKIYDIPPPPAGNPNEPVKVRANICCVGNKQMWVYTCIDYKIVNNEIVEYTTADIPVVRQADGSGTVSYSFEVVKEIKIGDLTLDTPKYIVSAKCNGYKTRTYTNVSPDTTRNLYLTPLRKIYVTAENNKGNDTKPVEVTDSNPTNIIATVVDASHSPISGKTVRFRMNKGSFYNDCVVHDYTGTTNSSGQVEAKYYGNPAETGSDIVVEATDDSAPLPVDNEIDDTYNYDWEQLHNEKGQPINIKVTIPYQNAIDTFVLTANPYSVPPTASSSTITAKLTTIDGTKIVGRSVSFSTTAGDFNTTSGKVSQVTALTNDDGEATAELCDVLRGGFAVVEASTTNDQGYTHMQRVQVDFLQSSSDDWPMFMHDVRHQGYSRFYDTTTTENFALAWSTPVPLDVAHPDLSTHWSDHPNPGYLVSDQSVIFKHPYIDSSPVHAAGITGRSGGLVFVGGYKTTSTITTYEDSQGYLLAIDPVASEANRIAWQYPTSGYLPGGVASTPAVFTSGTEKRVVFGCMDGKVYCLNAATGNPIWAYQTTASGLQDKDGVVEPARVLASPTVDSNGVVYIGNESNRVYALDGTTNNINGSLLWSIDLPDRDTDWPDRTGVSSVALSKEGNNVRLYVGSDNGHLYCIDAATHAIVEPQPGLSGLCMRGSVESSPTIYAGNVYAGASLCNADQLLCFDAGSLEEVWGRNLTEEARSTVAAADGHIYEGVDTGKVFYSLKSATGRTIAYREMDYKNYFLSSAAITSAGMVYVGNINGTLYKFNRPDLSGMGTFPTTGIVTSSPAISYAVDAQNNRWIFITTRGDNNRGDGKGTLFAFKQVR
ncbi:MAG: PQQ-binding-like beta-propeller repeat protein [Armatimonadota bacterium]